MHDKVSREHFIRSMQTDTSLFPTTNGNSLTNDQRRELFKGRTTLIKRYLSKGKNVQLPAIGTLKIKTYKSKKGLNFNDGSQVSIQTQRRVKFEMTPSLKHAINTGYDSTVTSEKNC